ncbi:MAG: response regulator transcription factor, partial [Bacteroidales bacterium]|nr:response regulator transcription factor [Bacteroidales bacterium]
MRIVLIDDSDLLRKTVKRACEEIKNVEIVGEAKDGLTALEVIKDKQPDLIILDIRMPELNGISVLKKMKEEGTRCKICILTNYPHQQYKEKCRAEGADYFFDKNKDFKLMLITIE